MVENPGKKIRIAFKGANFRWYKRKNFLNLG